MCAEFLRLTEVNAVDCLQDLLQKHGQAIVSIASASSRPLPPVISDGLEALKGANSEEMKRGLFCFCISCIALHSQWLFHLYIRTNKCMLSQYKVCVTQRTLLDLA